MISISNILDTLTSMSNVKLSDHDLLPKPLTDLEMPFSFNSMFAISPSSAFVLELNFVPDFFARASAIFAMDPDSLAASNS